MGLAERNFVRRWFRRKVSYRQIHPRILYIINLYIVNLWLMVSSGLLVDEQLLVHGLNIWLVVQWPSWKLWVRQWEGLSCIWMEKKNIPNHQPAIVYNFKFSTSRWLIQKMVGPSHEQSPHEIRCLCQVLGPKCEPKPRRNFLRDSGTSMFYPAWFLRLHHVYLERSTICWVNQRTFDWAIFKSYPC
jgi:hypothetical protein